MKDRQPLEQVAPRMLDELEAFAAVVEKRYPFDPEDPAIPRHLGAEPAAPPRAPAPKPQAPQPQARPQPPVTAVPPPQPPAPAPAEEEMPPEPEADWKPPPPPVQGVPEAVSAQAEASPAAAPVPPRAPAPTGGPRPPKSLQNMPQSILGGVIAKGAECTICKVPLTADHVCKPRPPQPGETRVPIPE